MKQAWCLIDSLDPSRSRRSWRSRCLTISPLAWGRKASSRHPLLHWSRRCRWEWTGACTGLCAGHAIQRLSHQCFAQVASRGLRLGGGQGALRGVRSHAERGRVKGSGTGAHATASIEGKSNHVAQRRCRSARRSAACLKWVRWALAITTRRSRCACAQQARSWRPRRLRAVAQVVDEIFDTWAANKMGIDRIGQVCVMIHSGSRGLGHQARTAWHASHTRAGAHRRATGGDRLACRDGDRYGARRHPHE